MRVIQVFIMTLLLHVLFLLLGFAHGPSLSSAHDVEAHVRRGAAFMVQAGTALVERDAVRVTRLWRSAVAEIAEAVSPEA